MNYPLSITHRGRSDDVVSCCVLHVRKALITECELCSALGPQDITECLPGEASLDKGSPDFASTLFPLFTYSTCLLMANHSKNGRTFHVPTFLNWHLTVTQRASSPFTNEKKRKRMITWLLCGQRNVSLAKLKHRVYFCVDTVQILDFSSRGEGGLSDKGRWRRVWEKKTGRGAEACFHWG